jgi:hypothetical protein
LAVLSLVGGCRYTVQRTEGTEHPQLQLNHKGGGWVGDRRGLGFSRPVGFGACFLPVVFGVFAVIGANALPRDSLHVYVHLCSLRKDLLADSNTRLHLSALLKPRPSCGDVQLLELSA